MEQQIIGSVVSQGPWAALFLGVGFLLWKFVQKQIEDMKVQHQRQIDDMKIDSKEQKEYLMAELSRRDTDMSIEMKNRDDESKAREDRLYMLLEKSNELITGELQEMRIAIERRNSYENQR